jgi:hypothetical protein
MKNITKFLEECEEYIIDRIDHYAEHNIQELTETDKMAVVQLCEALITICKAKEKLSDKHEYSKSEPKESIWGHNPTHKRRR